MVVQHNMTAINANRYLGINNKKLSKSLEKLSSGYQINRAGDNAAGLAVSEKMRSQIAGMTQGVKNAQDGISMVQTFEGALTETHSILQRMKTLADQMANGSYDDPVDRTAAQQEFSQLNDELDQIADTDFNGVIVLNGGVMSDGQKAVNGKFDYTDITARSSRSLGKNDVNVLDGQNWDDAGIAKAAWAVFNTQWSRTPGQPGTNGPESIDVTFQYDQSTGNWTAIAASDGADYSKASINKNTANGGYEIKVSGVTGSEVNVVIDESNLANGDTLTITYNFPANGISAPTNAGATVINDTTFKKGSDTNAVSKEAADLTIAIDGNSVKDATYTKELNELFKVLDGATVTANYTGAATVAGDMSITLANGTKLSPTAEATFTVNGTQYKIDPAAAAGTLDIQDSAGTSLVKINMTKETATTNGSTGSISYKLGFENYKYDEGAKPSVEVAKTGNVSVSNTFRRSEAVLTYSDSITLQVGARTKDAVNFTFEYASTSIGDLKDDLNCTAKGLGTDKLSIADQESANAAVDKIDQAINKVSLIRGTFGAIQNRLDHKIDNMNVSIENLTSAESQIRDTNMAEEMMNFTKTQILAQASQSMLAQANQLPQGVLSLLQ